MKPEIAKLGLDDLKEGDLFSFEEVITAEMVDRFAALSGDYSPLHVDEEFARGRGFRNRVVHGVLMTALLSRLVGVHFPGEKALIQSINARFLNPAYIGDRVRVEASIDQVSEAARTIVLKAVIENAETKQVLVKGKIQVGLTA